MIFIMNKNNISGIFFHNLCDGKQYDFGINNEDGNEDGNEDQQKQQLPLDIKSSFEHW